VKLISVYTPPSASRSSRPPSPVAHGMLPINLTARRRTWRSGGCGNAKFLRLAKGRVYAIGQPVPASSDRVCVGSSPDGWLVPADDAHSDMHLLNPVTTRRSRCLFLTKDLLVPLPLIASSRSSTPAAARTAHVVRY
jgi:hypothetical protein